MKNIFELANYYQQFNDIASKLEFGNSLNQEFIVSIVMPIYKHPDFLKKALISAVNQDFNKPYEIVVVDNDDSFTVEQSPNFKVIKEVNSNKVKYYKNTKNIGMCGNWNRCIELAKGKFIVFCHDDERLEPNALSTLYNLSLNLDEKSAIFPNKNAEFSNGNIRLYPENKKLFGVFPRKKMYRASLSYFLDRTLGNGAGAWLNRECLLSLGGYNSDYYPCSDFALDIQYAYKFGAYRTNYAIITSRQGENTSFECYQDFAPRMKEIREFMKPLMKAPNFLIQYIIDVKYRTSKVSFAIAFGNQKLSYAKETKFIDRVVSKLYTYYIDVLKYKFF